MKRAAISFQLSDAPRENIHWWTACSGQGVKKEADPPLPPPDPDPDPAPPEPLMPDPPDPAPDVVDPINPEPARI